MIIIINFCRVPLQVITKVAFASKEDVDTAVAAAKVATSMCFIFL